MFSPVGLGRTPPHCEKYIIARVGRSRSVHDYFIAGRGSAFLIVKAVGTVYFRANSLFLFTYWYKDT